MNTKKYFLINLKQYLVLYIVSFALFATTAVSSVMSVSMYNEYFVSIDPFTGEAIRTNVGNMTLGFLNSPFFGILLILFIFVTIAPLFAMGARYSLAASDTYKQVAQKKNAIRIMNNCTLISAILIIFTIVFWLMVMAIAIRYNTAKIPNNYCREGLCYEYEKATINFGYYGVAYGLCIGFAALQYFISYLLVSRSNRLINSVFLLVIGELALALFTYSICNFINYFYYLDHDGSIFTGLFAVAVTVEDSAPPVNQISGTGNSSILLAINLISGISEPLIFGGESAFESMSVDQIAVLITSLAIFAFLATLGVLAMILEKDPSGEYAGKPETDNPYQFIIFHVGAFVIGFAIATILYSSIVTVMIIEVIIAALYFVFLGVLRRNFKLDLKNLIPLISVSTFNIVFALVISLVANQ